MRTHFRSGLATAATIAVLLILACSAQGQLWNNNYQFYPSIGYYNGGTVYYLMTDVSNQAYAQTFKIKLGVNINYSPILANALAPALRVFNDDPNQPNKVMEFMPSVYYVTNAPMGVATAQHLVFSAQWPVPTQVAGFITALNSTNGTITIGGQGCAPQQTKMVTFTFDPSTVFTKNGAVVGPGALCPCDFAIALVIRNAQGIPVAIRVDAFTNPPALRPLFEVTPPGTYMPLWRLKLVTWNNPANATVLKSEAAILAAVGAGANQLAVVDAGVVVGASILINSNGQKIPQGFAGYSGGQILVRLPTRQIYANGGVWKIIQLDYSDVGQATLFKGNYAPWLKRFNEMKIIAPALTPLFQPIYSFWQYPRPTQLWVVSQVPAPFGPNNANAAYTPLMNDWNVRNTGVTVYTSAAQITNPAPGVPRNATNYLAYEPVVGQ